MLNDFKKIHFVGIGGYGMSALAFLLLEEGFDVRGSDLNSSALTGILERAGGRVFLGHDARQVGDAELVIRSTAIPDHNPELTEARLRDIPIWHRSELLAVLFNEKDGIAIAGTHGKTTVTAMTAFLLDKGGLDPTAVIGGEVPYFEGNARLGKSPLLVAEADESDNSFLRYKPLFALITNIEADHLEHYEGDFHKMVAAYEEFVNNIKAGGTIFYCSDDLLLKELAPQFRPRKVSYGFSAGARVRGEDIRTEGLGSRFRFLYNEKVMGEISLKIPGEHNVRNALGAAAIALDLGLDFSLIKEAFSVFNGVRRRFEIIGEAGGIVVVDDYSHHPTEIRAALAAARGSGRRIVCLFQLHRFTRTKFLWQEFLGAFDGADLLVLTDIYPASEAPIPGIEAGKLAVQLKERGLQQVYHCGDLAEAVTFLQDILRPGDLLLTMGAGDVTKAGQHILKAINNIEL